MYRLVRQKWANKSISSAEELLRVELLVTKRSSPASTAIAMSPLISQASPQLSNVHADASDDYPYGYPSSEKRQVTVTRVPPSVTASGTLVAPAGGHYSPTSSSVESTPPPPPPETPSNRAADALEASPPPAPPSETETPPPPPPAESPEYHRSDSGSRYLQLVPSRKFLMNFSVDSFIPPPPPSVERPVLKTRPPAPSFEFHEYDSSNKKRLRSESESSSDSMLPPPPLR